MISIEILNDLITNHFNYFFIFQNIYDAKKKIKTQKLNIDIFIKILHDVFDFINWLKFFRSSKNINRVKKFFFVNKYVVEFLFKNFEIFVLNNICKSNNTNCRCLFFWNKFHWTLIFIEIWLLLIRKIKRIWHKWWKISINCIDN